MRASLQGSVSINPPTFYLPKNVWRPSTPGPADYDVKDSLLVNTSLLAVSKFTRRSARKLPATKKLPPPRPPSPGPGAYLHDTTATRTPGSILGTPRFTPPHNAKAYLHRRQRELHRSAGQRRCHSADSTPGGAVSKSTLSLDTTTATTTTMTTSVPFTKAIPATPATASGHHVESRKQNHLRSTKAFSQRRSAEATPGPGSYDPIPPVPSPATKGVPRFDVIGSPRKGPVYHVEVDRKRSQRWTQQKVAPGPTTYDIANSPALGWIGHGGPVFHSSLYDEEDAQKRYLAYFRVKKQTSRAKPWRVTAGSTMITFTSGLTKAQPSPSPQATQLKAKAAITSTEPKPTALVNHGGASSASVTTSTTPAATSSPMSPVNASSVSSSIVK